VAFALLRAEFRDAPTKEAADTTRARSTGLFCRTRSGAKKATCTRSKKPLSSSTASCTVVVVILILILVVVSVDCFYIVCIRILELL